MRAETATSEQQVPFGEFPDLPEGTMTCENGRQPRRPFIGRCLGRRRFLARHNTASAQAHLMATQYQDGRLEPFVSAAFDQLDGTEAIIQVDPDVARGLAAVRGCRRGSVMRIEAMPVRALCCVCGMRRHVNSRSAGDRDENRSDENDRHPQGWRCTLTLRCENCRARTRYARLRDELPPTVKD